MVAVRYDGHFDDSDFPTDTNCYVVLGNLTDIEKSMKREAVNYMINKSVDYIKRRLFLNDQISNPVSFTYGRTIFCISSRYHSIESIPKK